MERRPATLRDPIDYITNKGAGNALNITAVFTTGIPHAEIYAPKMLAAGSETITRVDWSRVLNETISIRYESEDGRKFKTLVTVTPSWHPAHTHEETS